MRSFFSTTADQTQAGWHPKAKRALFLKTRRIATAILVYTSLAGSVWAQGPMPILTSRSDNTRSGANVNETLLTPGNVNKNSFGLLFSVPIDYVAMGQPLYVPQVNIPGQGTPVNVVYVVTQNNSVYAFNADNGTQLWYASMNNGGAPAAVGSTLPCGTQQGFTKEGIIGTPVIDTTTTPPSMYLVAKSVINGTVTHYLHALDITTGNELTSLGSPVQISPPNNPIISASIKGKSTTFTSLHQKNRPGALLLNGVLYFGFGSNGCNDSNTGWVLAYDEATLQPLGAFNTAPDSGLTSIWQTGNGLAADEFGNLFISTAEATSNGYNVPTGGQTYSNSVLKLTPPPWSPQNTPDEPADYFTPWSVAYLNENDLDVSSVGPLVLPDQTIFPVTCSQNPCHEVIASGKQGIVYILDRDNMGQYAPGGPSDPQILQEFQLTTGGLLMCSPAYWNGTLYFSPDGAPLQAFQVSDSNGLWTLFAETTQKLGGAHSPSISANGTTNGILWVISSNQLQAYNALTLTQLYTTNQDSARDKLPTVGHFATQTIANGKVYVATATTLQAYGLFHTLTITSGNNQSGPVLSTLQTPLQVLASDPYSGNPEVGITVSFSDGGKGGTFNPLSAVTDSNGNVSTMYTLPKKAGVYTLTASAPSFGSVTTTATALPLAAIKLVSASGGKQTGAAGSTLPKAITVISEDTYSNPVSGVTVNFSANNNGILNPTSIVTNAKGDASTMLQLPTTVGTVSVTAISPGLGKQVFNEYSVAGPAASIAVSGGNNQTASAGTQLLVSLSVLVTDQYGNPVPNGVVQFSDGGAGGSFSNPAPTTGSTGVATTTYTLPASPALVTITATVTGVINAAVFTETGQ